MDIYFFSYHGPDPEMIEELGSPITTQFRGTISDIHRRDNRVYFTETLLIGGQDIKCIHFISIESVVIVEGPLLLQEPWLKVGVSTLLIPQMSQEQGGWGRVSFKYCGLTQVHRIEVVTSPWTSKNLHGEKDQT